MKENIVNNLEKGGDEKLQKAIISKHLKIGIDKNGHQYSRKVNDDKLVINKTSKVSESSKKVPLWMKKFEGLKLNKMPVNIPEDKIHITYKEGDDPHFKSLMHWIDPKTNRRQDAYTKEFLQRNAEYKWQRISTVNHKIIDAIKLKSQNAIQSSDSDNKLKQSAATIWIISETGLRPGNLELFKITGNRGVTTLAPQNVNVDGDIISFNFTGKSYKDNTASIDNAVLAGFIKDLKKKNKDKEFLFDVDRHDANNTFKEKFGFKNLKLKDMRTYIATSMAKDILTEATDEVFIKLINNAKNKKLLINKKLNQVYQAVSQKLNNTPAMAKNSYIHPNVKKDWLALIGVNEHELIKSIMESDVINELLSEASLDLIVKKYPPTSDVIDINELDEEMCDYFPIEDWEDDENDVNIIKYIEDSLDINKAMVLSDDFEKNRSIKEYDWYEKCNILQKDLSEIPISKITIKQLYKSLMIVLSKAIVDNKNIVDFDSPLIVKMNEGKDIEVTTGKFCTWLYEKSNNKFYDDIGMVEAKKIIVKCNDNPFTHFMAKGITAMDIDFVQNNEILSEEVYNLLKSGGMFNGSYGVWNTNIEKAMKDLSKYKKIHKLIYRDGKSFITTLYVSQEGDDIVPEKEIELHPDSIVHKHAMDALSTGEQVHFMDKEILKTGKIISFKHHPITDKFGTAVIKSDDGKLYTKSLKLIRVLPKEKIDEVLEKTEKFPNKLADLTIGAKLDGSGENYIATDKYGNEYSLKKARHRGGFNINEQLKQSVLTDKLYAAMGIDVPESSYFQEGAVGYKISKFIDGKILGVVNRLPTIFQVACEELKKGFVMDCLVGNWDVIGANMDNIVISNESTYRIDNDGSLQFRARGGRKDSDQFNDKRINEFTTLLDSSKNPSSAEVFKGITDDEIRIQGQKIVDNADKLLEIINESDIDDKEIVKNVIVGRIAVIADKIKSKKKIKFKDEGDDDDYDKIKYNSKVTSDYFKNWDDLEIEGNPEIKESVKKQILKIEKSNEKNYSIYAKKHKITIEEYKKRLQEHIESLMSQCDFFRATDLRVLDVILNDTGRYKSQFETGTSHGSLCPEGRAYTEYEYFGFKDSKTHDVEKRPIYGYFTDNKNGVMNSSGVIPPNNAVSSYGEVIVKIKREVALKKATIMFEDSLGRDHERACTFAAKPHFTSFNLDEDPLTSVNKISNYPSVSGNYTECQYHNQLKLEDIESIHFTPFSNYSPYSGKPELSSYEKLNKIIEITRKTHLPIKIFEHK